MKENQNHRRILTDDWLGDSDTPSISVYSCQQVATVSAHASSRPTKLPVLKRHFALPRVQELTI